MGAGLSVQKYLELNESDTEEGESEDETNNVIESLVQRYISGYSVYMCAVRKTKCCRCLKYMQKKGIDENTSENLIRMKNYSDSKLALVNPSDSFF